ncbi:MAG: tetratricopeptide repeat protein [Crocinitomicaceae bacterium]|nr:tetratricopeptide repeat protein [Crocinitomicaceae bacterium]
MEKFKQLFLIVAAFIFSVTAFSEDKFSEGNQFYIEEHYKTAAKSYEEGLDSSHQNSELYYNLGNAYYKSDRIGLAIWAYEKALKLDPRNEDAKFNLEFVNLLSEDKIEQPDPALSEWLKRLLFGPYINLWAYVSIASSLLFSFVVILFIITKSRRIRNLSLMGGMLMAIILVFSTLTAYFHKNSITNESEAIVISEEADIHLSPMDKAAVSFKLHEGAKVKIIQENDSWTQIEVNGNSGWILEEEIKRI